MRRISLRRTLRRTMLPLLLATFGQSLFQSHFGRVSGAIAYFSIVAMTYWLRWEEEHANRGLYQ